MVENERESTSKSTRIKMTSKYKTAAEIRLALSSTVEDKVYYQKLIAEYEQDIQSAIDCYITVY